MFQRRTDLIVQQLDEETILYDPQAHRTLLLTAEASALFRQIEERPFATLAHELFPELSGAEAESRAGEVLAGLLEQGLVEPVARPEPGRRAFGKALAGTALSVVALSVNLPSPSAAASCQKRSYAVPVLAASGSVANTSVIFQQSICVPPGGQIQLDVGAGGVDDAFTVTGPLGARSYTSFPAIFGSGGSDPRTCGGGPLPMNVAGVTSVNISSLFNLSPSTISYITVNFTQCNFYVGGSNMPPLTIRVT